MALAPSEPIMRASKACCEAPPSSAMTWGDSGLVVGVLAKEVLRECWTPWTMDVCLWCPYDPDCFRSSNAPPPSVLSFGACGVWERSESMRPEAEVSARPRGREASWG